MSTKKKLIAGVIILVAAILFSVFVLPRNRDIPVVEETTAEKTTTMVESTADETTTDWFGLDWTTEPAVETTAATTAAAPRTTTKATLPHTTTTASHPVTTRAASATKPPATTTRRPVPSTTSHSSTTTRSTTTTRPTTSAADSFITYGINYGKSMGLTYRPQLTQGGEAVSGTTQQAIRARLDQAKAVGATQFNVWRQGGAVYIAAGR